VPLSLTWVGVGGELSDAVDGQGTPQSKKARPLLRFSRELSVMFGHEVRRLVDALAWISEIMLIISKGTASSRAAR